MNEGSKHIVLGDREAEERIQRARDARKEFFESEHNTTVESYSSKRDDFDDEDELSDNEEIPIDDPVTKVSHDDKGKLVDKQTKTKTKDAAAPERRRIGEKPPHRTDAATPERRRIGETPLHRKDAAAAGRRRL